MYNNRLFDNNAQSEMLLSYRWWGITFTGKIFSGYLKTTGERELFSQLERDNIALLSYHLTLFSFLRVWSFYLFHTLYSYHKKWNLRFSSEFSYQLSLLLSAQIPLPTALKMLAFHVSFRGQKKVLLKVAFLLSSGYGLAQILTLYHHMIPTMIRVPLSLAETQGVLPQVMKEVSRYFTLVHTYTRRVILILIAPFFTLFSMGVLYYAFWQWVYPILPFAAQKELSGGMIEVSWVLILGMCLLSMGMIGGYLLSEKMRFFLGWWLYSLPLVGSVLRKKNLILFLIPLSILLEAGVSLTRGIEIVSCLPLNLYLKSLLKKISFDLSQGKSIEKAFEKILSVHSTPLLDHTIHSLISSSSSSHQIVRKTAQLIEEDFAYQIEICIAYLPYIVLGSIGIGIMYGIWIIYIPFMQSFSLPL